MVQKIGIRNAVVKTCVVTLLAASVGLGALPAQTAQAQVSAFLGTPYYGDATTISQWFDPPDHHGIDFLLRYERVLAAAEGTITTLGWYNEDDRCANLPDNPAPAICGYGLHIRIQHAYAYDDYETRYGHLSTAIGSTSGEESWVEQGEVIATSGNTGWSTGPHLHFEVRHDGVRVDPFDENGVSLWLHGACTETSGNRCSGTPLPAPPQAGSITIDDGDTGFSRGYIRPYSSPWTYATDAGYNGDTYYGSNTTSSTYYRWAKWKPSLSGSTQGMYEVYVHVPSDHATTLRAKYTVNHAYGSTEALIVQAALPHTGWPNSTWVNIGTYFLSPTSRSVKITNETDGWDTSKYVGADAVRFTRLAPTYLPNTRASGGWDSGVIVRANGGTALTRIDYFDSSGSLECFVAFHVPQAGSKEDRPSWCTDPDNIRSAAVYADQDVSVVVENLYDDGVRYLAAAHPGEMAPATTVYAPYVVQKWFSGHSSWRQTTDLVIQNTSSQTATVTVTFYDSWGGYSGSHQETRTIPANGQIAVSGTEMPDDWESWWGVSMASAVIQSTQPVAVVARTYTGVANSSGVIVTPYLVGSYRAFTSGADEVYMPVAAREYYNYDSSLQVQNARNGYTSFRVKYYYQNGDQAGPTFYRTVGPYRSENLWRPSGLPSGFLGSAVVEVTYGGPVAAMAQYDTFDTSQNHYGVNQYEGVTAGTRSEVLPHVQGTSPWDWTGIVAQNMGGITTNITITFYNQSGSWADSETEEDVNPKAAALYWDTSMPDISGSAVASSNPAMPVALMVNFDRSGSWTNKDRMMGYGAVK